jgi:DNA-binding CsgD family transcriptional regulator/WD40 repeat protein
VADDRVAEFQTLTKQEQRLALAVGRGATNKATARQFGVSIKTVEYHLGNVYRKLDLQGRAELAHFVGACDGLLTDTDGVPRRSATRNPYHGLRAFDEADAPDFFGRERLVARLLELMSTAGADHRFVTVVGPSGCGKSSLLRAGLLPALRRGALEGSERWRIATVVPGAEPLERWKLAINGHATSQDDVLVVIDQFEELYTLTEPGPRDEFVSSLVDDTRADARLRVVTALRVDFLDRPLDDPRLAPMLEDGTVLVPPLTPGELDSVIVGPAQHAGVRLAAGLAALIATDVRDQPGMLPLLQYALTETFDRSDGGILTIDAYLQTGGVSGAVSRRAEQLYREGDEQEQAATQRLFTRLVVPGDATEDTGRRARLAELPDESEIATVLARFGAARLLTFDRDPRTGVPTIELAHEAIIREWSRLQGWLDADREGRRLHQDLTVRATAWADAEEDEGDLYRGGRLLLTEQWASEHQGVMSPTERRFLDASIAHRRADEDRRRRSARRTKRALLLVAVIAVLALVAGALAWTQQRRASSAAHSADRERDAAQAAESSSETGRLATLAPTLAKTDPVVALLLSAEAAKRRADPETWGALEQTLVGVDSTVGFLVTGDPVRSVFFDGTDRIVTVSNSAVTTWDATTHAKQTTSALAVAVRPINASGAYQSAIAFGGGTLAWIGDDSRAHVLDLHDGQQGTADLAEVDSVAVDATGGRVAVFDRAGDIGVYESPTMRRVWSVKGTGPIDLKSAEEKMGFHPGPELASYPVAGVLTFTPDGSAVIAFRGWAASSWDAASGRALASATFPMYVTDLGFEAVAPHRLLGLGYHAITAAEVPSLAHVDAAGLDSQLPLTEISLHGLPDGRVGVVTQQGHVTFLAAGTPSAPAPPPAPLLAGSPTSTELESLDAHVSSAHASALSPDGTTLAVGGDSGAALVRVDGSGLIRRAVPRTRDHVYYIGGRDAGWVGTSPVNTSAPRSAPRVWNCASGACVEEELGLDQTKEITSEPDRNILAVYSRATHGTGDWQFFDHTTGRPRSPRIPPELDVSGWVAIAPDASWVAIVNTGAAMQIFDMATGRLVSRTPLDTSWGNIGATSLPGGREVLLYDTDRGNSTVIDVQTGEQKPSPAPKGDIVAATFSPSGHYVATAAVDGTISLRDASTWKVLHRLTTAEGISPFMTLAFSDDDRFASRTATSPSAWASTAAPARTWPGWSCGWRSRRGCPASPSSTSPMAR